ncbi:MULTISPECIES: hypothetical protein [unclassified Spirosoma]|uniref:hypothetical protein n=1 Tax=unclassified Spirosoma TaxID=2621999 RepID=UPI00095BBF72|nr:MULTISPECIES: hypothetical protein [unclassified Spirosoma]MBN8820757.1 hypothetical protein [Spirosoma sp.]OJW78055.1 MAG: hypothetical protein BGO59_28985 [Spirosoma sp. 48-14]
MELSYSINAITFAQMGLFVSESEGVVDALKRKPPLKVDWPNAHGEVVDLSRARFEPRVIKLSCFMIAPNAEGFMNQLNALRVELYRPGTQRLRINPVSGRPFVYEVYCPDGVEVKKKWRNGKMFAQFDLTLIEPQPIKWILSAPGNATASMTLSAPSPLTFYWGDGSNTQVQGCNQTVSHTYGGSSSAVYYLIISGELDVFASHSSTNLTEIWTRLY